MVYVDNFRSGPQRWCHMGADSVVELDRFAQAIGLRQDWRQDCGRFVHYDVTWGMRGRAIRAGAKSVTCRELVEIMRAAQSTETVGRETQERNAGAV